MKRSSGVLMHISSLWGNYSCGSFGDSAFKWVDFLSQSGFTYWQVLPFCLPDEFNSPYKSYSTFSVNPYFIDIDLLVKDGLITPEQAAEQVQSTPYTCEFDRLSNTRIDLLKIAASNFCKQQKNVALMDAFFADAPRTKDFCTFMALREANGNTPWQDWTVTTPDPNTVMAWQFMQYTAITQWLKIKAYANSKGVKIIGDIPMYVSLDSSDVRQAPEMFKLNKKNLPDGIAGVPPDYFSRDGQVWGNPLYNWRNMKKDGYSWWLDRLKFMLKLFDGVRIDHFRALESFFSIPYGDTTAHNGKWLKGPGMDFIKRVRAAFPDAFIIAEDLGDITPEVRKLVDGSSFPGMRVLQFGFLGDDNSLHLPHNYSSNCVAYSGTHDNNTLLGFIWELDSPTRDRVMDYFNHDKNNWDNCYDTVLKAMLASHADTVIFPVQDLLHFGADTRLNVPGSCQNNWAWRLSSDQFASLSGEKYKALNSLYAR